MGEFMNTSTSIRSTGLAVLAAGLWLLGPGSSVASDSAAIRAAVLKLADAIEKNDPTEATKQVEALKQASLLDLMDLFKLRTSEGLGVGPRPREIKPDGIEAKLRELALGKQPYDPKRLEAEAEHLARMAYIVAAVAESTQGKPTARARKEADGLRKWQQWSGAMRRSAVELAGAVRAKDLQGIRAAALRVNASCSDCHAQFRQ